LAQEHVAQAANQHPISLPPPFATMWGPCKGGNGKGYGGSPYDAWGMDGYGKGGSGKGDAWAKGDGWGKGFDDPFAGKGGFGKSKEPSSGPGPKKAVWGQGVMSRFRRDGGEPNHNSWVGDVPGFKESMAESFTEAGVSSDLENVEEIMDKCQIAAQKQAKKYYNDERANTKMTGAQCRTFLGEFIEAVMSGFSNFLYDKPWFDKVSWNGALLMLTVNTFRNGKIFTRVMKTEICPFIDDGILAWSEEERVTRQVWKALEGSGIPAGNHMKKANGHLVKAYDDAHFLSAFGTSEHGNSLTPELVTLHEFVKGWMGIFASKAYSVLENGLSDSSPAGQVAALTTIFQFLMDPDSPCLPLSLQPSLPAAPWSYVEQCANEVVAELSGGK